MPNEPPQPPTPHPPAERTWTLRTWARIERRNPRLARWQRASRQLLRRFLPNETQLVFALTLLIGAVCGLAAVGFHLAIQLGEHLLIDRANHAPGSSWIFWTIASPTVGGLVAGAALTWIVPGARGSGIPQVKQAFAMEGGRVRFRDALGKFLIGSMQIGSGASLGREGPTVQICAGATSLVARATSLPAATVRRLTPVGVAAGIAAAFNAPIAAVTFTIEEIVGTLDQSVLSGVVVAAAMAAVIERRILGVHPVIEVAQPYGLDYPSSLLLYAALGLVAAMASLVFTDSLLGLRAWFAKFKAVPEWMHPAIGGLVTGVLAMFALAVFGATGITGGGYGTLSKALVGGLALPALLVLCVGKIASTVFSYSSGGAGGIFAPALFIGAMLGGAFGHLDVWLLHHDPHTIGAFALVGMGAVFAGIVRVPITSVLIIFEMTGDYGLVLPLMLANMISYAVARAVRPVAIYEALLAQDGVQLPHAQSTQHPLERMSVADAMTLTVITVHPRQTVREALDAVAGKSFDAMPVVDDVGTVLGEVSVADLQNQVHDPDRPVNTLMQPATVVAGNSPLLHAIARMNDTGVRHLIVVQAASRETLVGMITMSDVVAAHAKVSSRTRKGVAPRAEPSSAFSELQARELMVPAVVVEHGAKIHDLVALFAETHAHALVVHGTHGDVGVILPEHLEGLEGDIELDPLFVASDLAVPALDIDPAADVRALGKAMAGDRAVAAVVFDPLTKEPIGVVTKSALAIALLDAS